MGNNLDVLLHIVLIFALFPLLSAIQSIRAIPNSMSKVLRKEYNSVAKLKETNKKKIRPATSPEARENQLISLAVDLAERQLLEGTSSSQVITHYLKLGSTKEKIEREILEKQKELISAKTENLQSAKRIEELYTNAINAMKSYSGQDNSPDGDDDYDEY